jgi:hypothetical protein
MAGKNGVQRRPRAPPPEWWTGAEGRAEEWEDECDDDECENEDGARDGALYEGVCDGALYEGMRVGALYEGDRDGPLYEGAREGELYDGGREGAACDGSRVGPLVEPENALEPGRLEGPNAPRVGGATTRVGPAPTAGRPAGGAADGRPGVSVVPSVREPNAEAPRVPGGSKL